MSAERQAEEPGGMPPLYVTPADRAASRAAFIKQMGTANPCWPDYGDSIRQSLFCRERQLAQAIRERDEARKILQSTQRERDAAMACLDSAYAAGRVACSRAEAAERELAALRKSE